MFMLLHSWLASLSQILLFWCAVGCVRHFKCDLLVLTLLCAERRHWCGVHTEVYLRAVGTSMLFLHTLDRCSHLRAHSSLTSRQGRESLGSSCAVSCAARNECLPRRTIFNMARTRVAANARRSPTLVCIGS
mmetsp:Transcript_26863/g.75302  ORF Transcript_26863/g.75302 Transcript_26863/m.75302 type:complete len:132 (+) Transcript_26863:2265-2660(+)